MSHNSQTHWHKPPPGWLTFNEPKQRLHTGRSIYDWIDQSASIVGRFSRLHEEILLIDVDIKISTPMNRRGSAACLGTLTNHLCAREGSISFCTFSWHDTLQSQSTVSEGGDQTGSLLITVRGRGLRTQGPPIGRSADFPQTVVCFIKMHSDAASK